MMRSSGLKRVVDVIGALIGLLLFWPFMLAAALAVRLTMGPPVLFRQLRPGRGGIPFVIYKFRTMREERDCSGGLLPDEARLTRIGALLRKTSIDELPQLFNVLRGEMSLVGPRPLLMEYLPYYTAHESRRHEVRPGITGLAQIHGRNTLSWEERFAYDISYVENRSLLLDLQILLATVARVCSGQKEDVLFPSTIQALHRERTGWKAPGSSVHS